MATPKPLLVTQLAAQSARGEAAAAIFTDLDGTYVVEGGEAAASRVFTEAQAADWPLIAVTGRASERLLREVRSGELPPFTALVGAGGTEILLRRGTAYIPDKTYAAELASRYDRAAVERLTRGLIKTAPGAAAFQMQPKQASEAFKISLWFTAATPDDIPALLQPFQHAFPRHKLIVCEELYHNEAHPDEPTKYDLDIMPANKGDAIRYLMKTYSIKRGIVAGDSGNDVDALLVPNLISVLVGGHRSKAHDALRALYPDVPPGVIHASGNKHIFIDTHPARLGPESILLAMEHLRTGRVDISAPPEYA